MKRILFVCVGNVRRSPMAEGIFNVMVKNHKIEGMQAFSRGTRVQPEAMVEPQAMEALDECAASQAAAREAVQLRPEDVESAFRVYCMTEALCSQLREQYPQYAEKIRTAASQDITDPEDGSIEAYRKCRAELVDAVYDIVMSLQ